MRLLTRIAAAATLIICQAIAYAQESDPLATSRFKWSASQPLLDAADRPGDTCYSVKDPTIVRHDGKWHLFCTIRGKERSHQIEYTSFADFKDAATAKRHVMKLRDGYYCAPQVFYFTPDKKWYMILQVGEPDRKPSLQPAYSTTDDISDPYSWSPPKLLYAEHPANVQRWIDFWVICDDEHAHLFFASLDGKMWRAQTTLTDFPGGWDAPRVVLEGDVFEASHTYRLKGRQQYLTIIEAQASGQRYYKAYLADRLDGQWKPLAATREQPFAGPANVTFKGEKWTDSFSHGELVRTGRDERLEVDPANIRLLFQGVLARDMAGKPYGQIPWRLGLLEPEK